MIFFSKFYRILNRGPTEAETDKRGCTAARSAARARMGGGARRNEAEAKFYTPIIILPDKQFSEAKMMKKMKERRARKKTITEARGAVRGVCSVWACRAQARDLSRRPKAAFANEGACARETQGPRS